MEDDKNWGPLPEDPWNEIWSTNTPGMGSLWQGGMYFGPQMTACAPIDQFDVVVSMAGKGDTSTKIMNPDVIQHNFYIDDGRLGPAEMMLVSSARILTLEHIRQGQWVLVRCQAGLNRSGLVVGLVLVDLGFPAAGAIQLIRARRDPDALFNSYFTTYIYDYAEGAPHAQSR